MEKWKYSNDSEKMAAVLKGKTILKFDFPWSIEFTDGTAIEFDPDDNSWRDVITYYESGEKR